uniref:Uncharacterized protein n=1 Tax=Kalanchoe fedtschenkoi TaxID=63787 RepID=A0A7N0SYG0_KALFE
MRRNCCHALLAFILKFLNFLQTFLGVCIIVYSVFMLDQWNHRLPPPPPVAPPPWDADSVVQMASGVDDALTSSNLPAPWFIYSFMAVGVMLCSVTCVGLIAAEAINGCCLCFYSLLKVVVILVEASFVAFVVFDHHWEEDLPFDPTGELDSLKSFIVKNLEICKWVGITILIIQAVSLLLAFVLRATISTRRDDEYDDVESTREPLIHTRPVENSYSSKGDNIWSSRIRDKYGLGSSDNKYNQVNQTH